MLLPLVALVAILVIRGRSSPRPIWAVVVVVGALLAGSTWLAVQTGEDDEEMVEEAVPEGPVERHEEAGERLLILSGLLAVVLAAGWTSGRYGAFFRYAGLGATILVAASGIATGHSGGTLVYQHNAARVYAQGVSLAGDETGRQGDHRETGDGEMDDDDDEDDEDDDD